MPEDPLHLGTLVFLSKKDFEECAANASLIDDLETNWNVPEAYVVGNGKAGLKCTIVVLAVSASGQSADSRVNVICDHLEAINREGRNIVTARFYGMGRTLQISYIGQRKIGHYVSALTITEHPFSSLLNTHSQHN